MAKRVTLQPGDLVCYNAAGMKARTLAHVVEVRHPKPFGQRSATWGEAMEDRIGSITVLWIKVGHYKPRSFDYPVKPGHVVKHPYTSAFEKVKERG